MNVDPQRPTRRAYGWSLMITGDTFPLRDGLKSAGFRWSRAGKAWIKFFPTRHAAKPYLTKARVDGLTTHLHRLDQKPDIDPSASPDNGWRRKKRPR